MEAILNIIFAKAFQLFLVLDPIGNTGIIATLISGFDKKTQRRILVREVFIALFLLLLVYFTGSLVMDALKISQAAITITGGIIFFLFALSLLFPDSGVMAIKNLKEEPFIVPIATPLVVGPSSLATVILFSNDAHLRVASLGAIFLAWICAALLIFAGPFLLSHAKKNGMLVIERFIGMICALVAVKMVVHGIGLFVHSLK